MKINFLILDRAPKPFNKYIVAPTEPVNNRSQIIKTCSHQEIGNIHCPSLIGSLDTETAQQIGINLMPGAWFGGSGSAVQSLNAHALHQGTHMTTTDTKAFVPE